MPASGIMPPRSPPCGRRIRPGCCRRSCWRSSTTFSPRASANRPKRALPSEVGRGVYRLESFQPEDIAAAERVIAKYAALEIGLADASIVVLATRYGVRDLLTLDERHFRAIRGPGSRPFRILPADA